jgi:hypothetical protein
MDAPAIPKYAVIFKVHYWDGFTERQFRRLCKCVGAGDVFVVVDETRGEVPGIHHDKILRLTEQSVAAGGYYAQPAGALFWWNTEYPLYHFADAYPDYDYVVMCEYDVTADVSIDTLVSAMAGRGLQFVGEEVRTPREFWHWKEFAVPFYGTEQDYTGRFLCFAAFSMGFVRHLQAVRRRHTAMIAAGEVVPGPDGHLHWPNNEAFVGVELARAHVPQAPLALFANTSRYDWAPATPEFLLPQVLRNAVIHPVLDSRRYLHSLAKLGLKPEDLFSGHPALTGVLDRCDLADVVPMYLQYFADKQRFEGLDGLRGYVRQRGGDLRELFNAARNKPATQSSLSRWSRGGSLAHDAAGALAAQIPPDAGFHTDDDEQPWWCVDLDGCFPVQEICVHNRAAHPQRAAGLTVSCSTDLEHWSVLYVEPDASAFSRGSSPALEIRFETPVTMRFLKLHLPRKEVLHLASVKVYV